MANSKGNINGFEQHGLKFIRENSNGQAESKCPACKSNKFFINLGNQLWDCKRCGLHGNFNQFLELAADLNSKKLVDKALDDLAADRCLNKATFKSWQVGYCPVMQHYTYPSFVFTNTGQRKVSDLRRYVLGKPPRATKGGKNGLLLPKKWIGKGRVWICEGEWDAFAWSEVLRRTRIKEDVVGVCGASNFPKDLAGLFKGREVVLLFDNDEPGQRGMARTWSLIAGLVKSIKRLEWSEELPDGFDVRDAYIAEKRNAKKTFMAISKGLTADEPKSLLTGTVPANINSASLGDVDTGKPDPNGKGVPPAKVVKEYRKWLELRDTDVIDVMFGSIFANRIDSDPLWLFLVAPPGGAKSELLMSLGEAPLLHLTSSITPHALISGMQGPGGDPSLIPKLNDKVLIVKDLTTILSGNMAEKDALFGILRDAYDGKIEKRFGNGIVRNYESKFGIISGVTNKIDKESANTSVLGERFLRYRMPAANQLNGNTNTMLRVLNNLVDKSSMRDELRKIGKKVLDREVPRTEWPTIPENIGKKIIHLAQWVSNMRGTVDRERYTNMLTMKPVCEVGTRLTSQLGLLSMGIAIYRGLSEVDNSIYKIIAKVATDTIPDKIEEVVKQLFTRSPHEFASVEDIAKWSHLGSTTARFTLEDMEMLKLAERKPRSAGRWRLRTRVVQKMQKMELYSKEKAWIAN